MPEQARETAVDMRLPGENFCADCPDREGCSQGAPCYFVRLMANWP